MARVTQPNPAWLQQALQGGDPAVAIAAASAAAYLEQNPPHEALLRMFDPFYTPMYEINDHIDLKLTDPRQSLPAGSLTLKASDPAAVQAITCDTVVVPIVYDKGGYRWSGRIDVAHDEFKGGKYQTSCELIGDKHWLDRILAWPNPFTPIFIQDPSQWFAEGPGLTVIFALLAEQFFRIQSGLWEMWNNISGLNFDWRAWLSSLLTRDGLSVSDILQAIHTPVCIVPIDPLKDASAWIEINGRMDTCWKLIQQQLTDNGFYISAVIWLPGEPQPPGIAFPLIKPTVVVRLQDLSGLTGPVDNFLGGIVVDAVQLEGSLSGQAISPLITNPNNQAPFLPRDLGEFVAPRLGVNFNPPWVVLNLDEPRSGVIEHSVDHHAPLCWQVVVGGQSPKWINDLINATLEWAVDAIQIAIGITGIPSSLLDGIFDNTLLAFTLVENFSRRLALGPFGFPEKFFPSGAGSLTIDTFMAEVEALWSTRGWPSAQITFIDGYPYELGRDLFPSQLVFYTKRNQIYVDYLENIEITDDRSQRNKVVLQVGDGKAEEGPMTKIQRKLVGFETINNIILSGGNPSTS